MMKLPQPVEPLLKAVWNECAPLAMTPGGFAIPGIGEPPGELRIYQAAGADWERAMIRPPYIHAWRYKGGPEVDPIAPDEIQDHQTRPTGMYWPVGEIAFCIDLPNKRAVFTYALGPRYARGYRTTFENLETSAFVPDRGTMVWMA